MSRGERIDESLPFAELWVGAHKSGPALVGGSGGYRLVELSQYIERRYWRGTELYRKHHLPFLFKVLSVAAPLSIQAHPGRCMILSPSPPPVFILA